MYSWLPFWMPFSMRFFLNWIGPLPFTLLHHITLLITVEHSLHQTCSRSFSLLPQWSGSFPFPRARHAFAACNLPAILQEEGYSLAIIPRDTRGKCYVTMCCGYCKVLANFVYSCPSICQHFCNLSMRGTFSTANGPPWNPKSDAREITDIFCEVRARRNTVDTQSRSLRLNASSEPKAAANYAWRKFRVSATGLGNKIGPGFCDLHCKLNIWVQPL